MINNLLITGIPRSGTSYACALLNSIDNTVIINEPQEIFHVLRNGSEHTLKEYYDSTRNRINCRVPVQNKIANGKYIEDTNKHDIMNYHVHVVSDQSFVLGTKNTLVYLVCLRKVLKQFDDIKILAFMRHPYDTISSWKKVMFPHIRQARPLFLKDYVDDAESGAIARICNSASLETRYALLWNYLAMRLIDSIDDIVLYKYEEFVISPAKYLSELFSSLGVPMQLKQEFPASGARKHANVLSEIEIDCIREHCNESAGFFGYEV